MDKAFMKKYPRFFFFLDIKSNCGLAEKERKKEYVANDSICSELDATPVAAFDW